MLADGFHCQAHIGFIGSGNDYIMGVVPDAGGHCTALQVEALQQEQLNIRRLTRGSEHSSVADLLGELTLTLLAAQKFAEAESSARECLAIREKANPDDWRTFAARSLLGACLLAQKKYAEAEPLLLAGYEGMEQRKAQIPAAGRPHLRGTPQRLVQLYEATDRPDQAAEWEQRLAEFQKAEAGQKPATPPR